MEVDSQGDKETEDDELKNKCCLEKVSPNSLS